MIDVNITVLLW